MITKKYFYLLAFTLVVSFSSLVAQTSHEEKFEKAKYTMETKGDLKNAIQQFEEIIKTYPDEAEIGAKSQFYIGLCYERLGITQAKKAYEKVIQNYPGEVTIVNLAKEKLSRINVVSEARPEAKNEFQLKQVWADPYDNSGAPSPDGRYISFVNWRVPCKALYEIETGEWRDIPSTSGEWGEVSTWPENSIWSPDGKKLAYVWYGEEGVSIRSVGIDSSEPEEVYDGQNVEYCHPYAWSSDGKYVLLVLCKGDQGHDIGLVSIEDHSFKLLKKLRGGSHPLCSLSPDDKFMTYSFTPDLNDPHTDIFLVRIEDGSETVLIDHPKTDFAPLWMPDGKQLLFFSDRTGTVSVWSQAMKNGKTDGEEKLIKNLNRLTPMGLNKRGELYLTFHEGYFDVYNGVLDPETGKFSTAPERVVESHIGWNGGACFSPDGKSMAYVSQRGVLNPTVSWGQQTLVIRNLETGEERELIPKLKSMVSGPISPPQWSPSGDEIVVTGRNEQGHNGGYIINLNDASYETLLEGKNFIGREVIWSENNSKLYYRINGTKDSNGFYEIDRKSNTQTLIYNEETMQEMRLHPKGNLLAFTEISGNSIGLLDIDKKEAKVIINLEPEVRHTCVAWSPDGEWLYYVKCFGEEEPVELWRTTLEGKQNQLIDDSVPHFVFFTVHPDGKRIAFTVGKRSGESSLWVMKNFSQDPNH